MISVQGGPFAPFTQGFSCEDFCCFLSAVHHLDTGPSPDLQHLNLGNPSVEAAVIWPVPISCWWGHFCWFLNFYSLERVDWLHWQVWMITIIVFSVVADHFQMAPFLFLDHLLLPVAGLKCLIQPGGAECTCVRLYSCAPCAYSNFLSFLVCHFSQCVTGCRRVN